jgi:hypothetical protein
LQTTQQQHAPSKPDSRTTCMLVKLHVIFLLGALLDERKKKTYTKQPMVKFASAPGGYFNYIYLIKPSESISDKHPIQKHHVLYFQLITIFKKICGQTFFFWIALLFARRIFLLHYNYRSEQISITST